jgi:hypothetical protein
MLSPSLGIISCSCVDNPARIIIVTTTSMTADVVRSHRLSPVSCRLAQSRYSDSVFDTLRPFCPLLASCLLAYFYIFPRLSGGRSSLDCLPTT